MYIILYVDVYMYRNVYVCVMLVGVGSSIDLYMVLHMRLTYFLFGMSAWEGGGRVLS